MLTARPLAISIANASTSRPARTVVVPNGGNHTRFIGQVESDRFDAGLLQSVKLFIRANTGDHIRALQELVVAGREVGDD